MDGDGRRDHDEVVAPPANSASTVAMETAQGDRKTPEHDETIKLPETQPEPGSVLVVIQSKRNPAGEKLERVRKWSVSAYKCARQSLSEKFGRGSRTVDLDLEPHLELLADDRQRYSHMTKLAQTLANQLAQFAVTQKSLGDALAELSIKTPALQVEFGINAAAQKFLSRNGETLTTAINTFSSDISTLVNTTMEDTMMNVRLYESARIEYDAYRVDLEELNLGPRDAVTLPRLEQAQRDFQGQRERYQRIRDDLSIKVKLLEENKVKVLHNHLWLLHSAVATETDRCHRFLQQNIRQAGERLGPAGVDAPSWLEES